MLASVAALATHSSRGMFARGCLDHSVGPNERLSVAVIGVNGRGDSHLDFFASNNRTQVTHVCDCDESVGNKKVEAVAEKQGGRRPSFVRDLRKLFEDQTIDIVTIATPNHWHSLAAIWAVQAGKDVYVEKPVSHNVFEGRRLVQAARKYGRIVQTGTQSRSAMGARTAIQFIHDGGIGDVRLARGLCYKRRPSIGPRGNYEVPKNVDYDLWLGPAPWAPLTRPNFHYDWHWQWPYGNGDLGNQGIHQMDVCRWALGQQRLGDRVLSFGGRFGYEDAGETANTQVVVHDFGQQQIVFEVRGLPTQPFKGQAVGVLVEGSNGYVGINSSGNAIAFDDQGTEIRRFEGSGDVQHFENFIDAVLSREYEMLHADVEQGHLSSALCHLGNVSFRLGEHVHVNEVFDHLNHTKGPENFEETLSRMLEHLAANAIHSDDVKIHLGPQLEFDPPSESFRDSDSANQMLTREYREPYVVPSANEI